MRKLQVLGLLSLMMILFSFKSEPISPKEYKIKEVINTLEDMIEYIEYDTEGGNIDPKTADIYIYNLDACIQRLQKK